MSEIENSRGILWWTKHHSAGYKTYIDCIVQDLEEKQVAKRVKYSLRRIHSNDADINYRNDEICNSKRKWNGAIERVLQRLNRIWY
jgi:hypothetical protein